MSFTAKLHRFATSHIARSATPWVALLLISAAILGTAVYSYRDIHNELTSVDLSRRDTVAQLMADNLEEKFGRVMDVAISLSTRVKFRGLVAQGKWGEAIELMRDIPRELPHIERLFITDLRGTLQADVPALAAMRGKNLSSHEWFQGVSRKWRPYVTSVYMRVAAPRFKVFAVAAPIKSDSGDIVGILVLQIRVESLLAWVETIGSGPEGFVYIVDSKGQVAFHSKHRNQDGIVNVSETAVAQRLQRGEHGVETEFDAAEGEDSIVAYVAVPGHKWGVVVQQPARASLGLVARDEQLRRLMTGYGLILLLGAAGIFLTSRIAVERRRAETDRQMKAELEQRVIERTAQLDTANKELEAFSYSVSHDLRAPLRAIDGFSLVLLENCADRLDDVCKSYLGRVRAATLRMSQLIDDMLQLARVTRTEIHHNRVDLSALAESVVGELQRAEPQRRVDVTIQPGLQAEGDAALLRIVLTNLLSNAWKFTGRQPVARIDLGRQNHNGEYAFFVRDNGVGFDMAYVHKLFGAFQRLHTPSEFPGSGIGLATVQRIVHRHGGRVWVQAAADQGATFYFTLPLAHRV